MAAIPAQMSAPMGPHHPHAVSYIAVPAGYTIAQAAGPGGMTPIAVPMPPPGTMAAPGTPFAISAMPHPHAFPPGSIVSYGPFGAMQTYTMELVQETAMLEHGSNRMVGKQMAFFQSGTASTEPKQPRVRRTFKVHTLATHACSLARAFISPCTPAHESVCPARVFRSAPPPTLETNHAQTTLSCIPQELQRELECPHETCTRRYASRSSLATHIRLKHSPEAKQQVRASRMHLSVSLSVCVCACRCA